MHRSSYALIALAFAVAALAAAGCGGSDSETTGQPAAMTEETATAEETVTEETTTEETTTEETTTEEESGEATEERVAMRMIAYQPKTITVPVNTTIRWTNEESADHTVTSTNGTKLQSKILDKGGTYEATFDKPGKYHYFCEVHPFMKGTVIVEKS